jgi:hypothetical protein
VVRDGAPLLLLLLFLFSSSFAHINCEYDGMRPSFNCMGSMMVAVDYESVMIMRSSRKWERARRANVMGGVCHTALDAQATSAPQHLRKTLARPS